MEDFTQYGSWPGALSALLNKEGQAKILQRHKSEKAFAWKIETVNADGEVKTWKVTAPARAHSGLATCQRLDGAASNG